MFPKVDQVQESQDYGAFFLASEQTGIGGSHPGSLGGTTDLAYMRVHEFEDAMFEDEIAYYAHYMGRWTVCGQQVLVFFHEVNHGCYVFFVWNVCVQERDISCDQEGIVWEGGSFSTRLKKCFVFLTCDGRLLTRSWMKWVMQAERWLVGPSHPETIGQRGQPDLRILGSPEKRGVRVFLGGSKNSQMALSIMCLECIYSMIVHVVGLQVSGLYVLRSCRQVWILARQSLLFIMQIAVP